ncbi:MAG TPA: Mov34/MPN/PAD-1 family protein [Marinilabiliaceae bacterium]|nr:Mov34/MPN/PAD-1 family protein [Marinilabiliaceae bacterium]
MWNKLYNGVTISDNPKRYIIFSEEVINLLKAFQQNTNNSVESGGLLLGKIRGEHFEVTQITTPLSKDRQSKYCFERIDPNHIKIMNRLKKKSNGEITYLGEWHTHIQDIPQPSGIDLNEWHAIKSRRKYVVVFLIVGRKGFFIA